MFYFAEILATRPSALQLCETHNPKEGGKALAKSHTLQKCFNEDRHGHFIDNRGF